MTPGDSMEVAFKIETGYSLIMKVIMVHYKVIVLLLEYSYACIFIVIILILSNSITFVL